MGKSRPDHWSSTRQRLTLHTINSSYSALTHGPRNTQLSTLISTPSLSSSSFPPGPPPSLPPSPPTASTPPNIQIHIPRPPPLHIHAFASYPLHFAVSLA